MGRLSRPLRMPVLCRGVHQGQEVGEHLRALPGGEMMPPPTAPCPAKLARCTDLPPFLFKAT